MLAESSPVVARWELSRRLAARRKELGVDVKTITNALGFTRNYWSAVENDRTLLAEDKLHLLFDVLRVPDEECTELLQLREDSRSRAWWDEFPTLGPAARRLIGLESGARSIRAYESHILHGLLQTDDYARALLVADPINSEIGVDKLLTIRRRRQDRLLQPDAPEMTIILSEAALRQQVGGKQTQVAQLRKIAELTLAEDTKLELRVLPFDVNPGMIASSSTLLFFEFASPHLPDIVWQEAIRPIGEVDSEDEQFLRLDRVWQDGLERTLDPEQSLAFVDQVISQIESA